MQETEFAQNIQGVRGRIDSLHQRAEAHPTGESEVLVEAFAELQTTLEELQVAEEELREQNEELLRRRESVETERQRYQELFEFAPDGYISTDAFGLIREANQAAAALLNALPEYLSGTPLANYIAQAERRDFRDWLTRLARENQPQEWEAALQPKQGAPFPASLRVACVRDPQGALLDLRWLLRDITERKEAEDRIRALNAELEQRVRERTAQLEAALQNEQAARAEAEQAQRMLAFLAEASAQLAVSVDYGETLATIARLAVSFLADACIVTVQTEEGRIEQAASPADPAQNALLQRLLRYPLKPDERHPILRALHADQSSLYSEIPDELYAILAHDDAHEQLLREAGMQSAMVVPIPARRQTLGALTLLSARPRRYNATDLALAEDLARRAGLALENARLHQASHREIQERRQAERKLAQHQTEIQRLNDRLKRAMVETHHRVKNNLQVIAAMVDMQLMEEKESIPIEEYRQMGGHIRALAAIHDLLTQRAQEEGAADSLEASAMLYRLLPLMQQSAGERPIQARIEEAQMTTAQGTSLAIIANELVSNAVKYGKGEIQFQFTHQDGGIVLEVCDSGPGFPAEFSAKTAMRTGLNMVEHLARFDLRGETRYRNAPEGGACVAISFPLEP